MTEDAAAPRLLGRITGGLYLVIMIAAMFGEGFVRDTLVVSGDAALTAQNIVGSEALYRWSVVADITTTFCDVAVAALLYVLLRPVNRAGAVLAAFLRLAYSAAMALNAAFLIGPLLLLSNPPGLSGPDAPLIQFMVTYSLRLHTAGFQAALVLFGAHLIVIGVLIAQSRLVPRAIGVALAIAGSCYIANSLVTFAAPEFARVLFPWLLLPGFVAEGALTLWLLIASVSVSAWARLKA